MIFYSVHFNRPDFIEIQKKCIDRIGGILVVINNSDNKSIEDECIRLGVKFYNYSGGRGMQPSVSHGMALNYIREIIDYDNDWAIIDHDLFPMKKIDMSNHDIGGILQSRDKHTYIWPGFMCVRKNINVKNINFLPDNLGDTGSGTSVLLDGKNRIMEFNEKYIGEATNGFLQNSVVFINISDLAIHYLNGSSWMSTDITVIGEKNKKLLEFLEL